MVTLADIFREHDSAYQEQFGDQMLSSHYQAMQAIIQCRTAALGGQVYTCDACDHTEFRYHSCRSGFLGIHRLSSTGIMRRLAFWVLWLDLNGYQHFIA